MDSGYSSAGSGSSSDIDNSKVARVESTQCALVRTELLVKTVDKNVQCSLPVDYDCAYIDRCNTTTTHSAFVEAGVQCCLPCDSVVDVRIGDCDKSYVSNSCLMTDKVGLNTDSSDTLDVHVHDKYVRSSFYDTVVKVHDSSSATDVAEMANDSGHNIVDFDMSFDWEQLPQRGCSSDMNSIDSMHVYADIDEWLCDDKFWLHTDDDDVGSDRLQGLDEYHDNSCTVYNNIDTIRAMHAHSPISATYVPKNDLSSDVTRAPPQSSSYTSIGSECHTIPIFSAKHVAKCDICFQTKSALPHTRTILDISDKVCKSGMPNCDGCRISVPSHLNISAWRDKLQGFSDAKVVDYLEFGWPIGCTAMVKCPETVINHLGAREFSKEVSEYLVEGVSHGHIIGPFPHKPTSNTVLSPLNTVPKKDTAKRRVILDLSAPQGAAVNDTIPKDSYLGCPQKIHLPTVDNLVTLVREKGRGCHLYKRDLKGAYRQIPVDPGDIDMLGYKFHGHIFCDCVLPMGLRSACQACQRTTNGVAYAAERMGHCIVNYIDDLAGAEIPILSDFAFNDLADLLSSLGLIEAHDKACPPSTVMNFLGIEFDTVAETLTIPPQKLTEIKELLVNWSGKTKATKKEVQSLVGSLNFLAACIRPGRIFMSRLLNLLRKMPDKGTVPLDSEFLLDIKWWRLFAPSYNGVSLMPVKDWSESDSVISCDACLQGAGGCQNGEFFHTDFPDTILAQCLHINALELLTLMVALKLWGDTCQGQRIKLYCDNAASVCVLNTGKTQDKFLQACLREICLLAAKYEFEVRAVHLPGVDNRLPDLLSRWSLSHRYRDEFFQLTSHLAMKECVISDELFEFSHTW